MISKERRTKLKWKNLTFRLKYNCKLDWRRKRKKLKESQRNMKAYKNQLKELDESKAQMERKILALQEKIHQLECEIEELKEKMEEKDNYTFQLKREVEQKELDHKNIIQRKTDEHAKEINDLTYDHDSRMKKQEKTHSKELAHLEETVQDLTKDLKMQSEYKEYAIRYYEENQPILFIGQVCSDLETNWYRHVMPKFYINNHRSYKVKDIIEDLNDPKIPEDEKAKANGRWEQLKREINWEKNERLLNAIKELQGKRNQAAHPRKDLNEKGAKQAAKKLQEQGNLNDEASHKDVLNIIKFWVSSKKLS